MDALSEKIIELNQNYNNLGEDLVLLEALVEAACRDNEFPEDCIESASHRMADYIEQHAEAINQLAKSIIGKPSLPAGAPLQTPSCRAGRQAAEHRDMELLRWLVGGFLFGKEASGEKKYAGEKQSQEKKELLRHMLGQAAERGFAEGSAFLLDVLHQRFPAGEERFEF